MMCPFCLSKETKVVETRPIDGGRTIKRRRFCQSCGRRYTTFERVEFIPLRVKKRDGTCQTFNKEKIVESMLKACRERKISEETIRALASKIEYELWKRQQDECSVELIEDRIIKELSKIDQVSCIRYAVTHGDFKDLESFLIKIRDLLDEKGRQ